MQIKIRLRRIGPVRRTHESNRPRCRTAKASPVFHALVLDRDPDGSGSFGDRSPNHLDPEH
jgi:hypothetical protein